MARRALRVVTLAAVALAFALLVIAIGLRLFPHQVLVVRSGSMEPAVPVGALAVLEPIAAADLDIGDVIVFTHPARRDELVLHRIVEMAEGGVLTTRGDANGRVDPWHVPAVGSGWRFAFEIPLLGYVIAALGSATARYALIVLPVLALIALTLVDLWRPRRAREIAEDVAATQAPAA